MKNKYVKNGLLCLGMMLSGQSMLQGAQPASAASSFPSSFPAITEIDQKIDQLTVKDIKQPNVVRDLIKANPERALHHCVNLALKDFEKNKQTIDPKWVEFFSDERFFNNKKNEKYLQHYYEKNSAVKDLIHYKIQPKYTGCYIVAKQGIFPIGYGIVGQIDYVYSDKSSGRSEIQLLSVLSTCTNRGIATELLNRALADIKSVSKKPQDVYVRASSMEGRLDILHGVESKPLPLDALVAFYQKRGAVLIAIESNKANMMFQI